MKGLCVPFVLAVCAFGCTTATYELNEDIGVQGEWTPEFAMPLGSVTMDLDGLEAWLDTEDFVQNEAGTEFVYVRSIPLFDVGADDLLTWGPESASIVHGFSSAEAAALNAAPDGNSVNVSFESTFDVGGGLGCSVEEAVFAGGSLVVSCVVEGPVGGFIGVTLPTLVLDGMPVEVQCAVGGSVQVPLAGCTWNLASPIPAEFSLNAIPGPGNSVPGETVQVSLTLDPSAWSTLAGSCAGLPPQSFSGSYTVDLFSNRPGQVLHVADPRIYLTVENEQGIGAQITIDGLSVSTAAGSMEIGGPGIESIPPLGPASPWGSMLVWTHMLSNANTTPNLSAVWDASTGTFHYSGSVGWLDDPAGAGGLIRSGRVRGTATLEFPFNGYASGFVLRDTLKSDIAGALEDALPDPFTWDDVDAVTVRVHVENELPVGGRLEAFFADSAGTPLESLFGGALFVDLVPGMVDFTLPDGHPDAGRVVAAGEGTWDVRLDGATAAFLVESGCDRIVLRAEATSHGAEAQRNVRFFPESAISVACAARIDLNIAL